MVRVVLSALIYAGKNQSPCLHEKLAESVSHSSSCVDRTSGEKVNGKKLLPYIVVE